MHDDPEIDETAGREMTERRSWQLDRRRALVAGAGALGAAWVVPEVVSTTAAAAQSGCIPLVLDWDNFSLGTTFTNTIIGGINVTLSTTALPGTTVAAQNRQIVAGPSGGIAGNALFIGQNSNANNVGQDVTFTFGSAVQNVQFTITDIDNLSGAWLDRVQILTTGYTFAFAPGTLLTGNGTAGDRFRNTNGNLNLPNTDSRGNVTLTFPGPLTSFSFRYQNGNVAGTAQLVRVTDLTFETCT